LVTEAILNKLCAEELILEENPLQIGGMSSAKQGLVRGSLLSKGSEILSQSVAN
jgi:hypothetical protein